MAIRSDFAPRRTDRPDPYSTSLTVRDVIALEALTAGRPQLLAGEERLDEPVRWVHASDSPDVARLLDGGELLLSTGSGWPDGPAGLRELTDQLVDAGLACLVLELGTRYRTPPAAMVAAAQARGLPLVCLHREVKFVNLTEAVHRRVIAQQTTALRARDDVRTRFTALALRGSPADFIVEQLAQTLQAPVVLENLAHEVVVAQTPAGAQEVLGDWQVRSRSAHHGGVDAPQGWLLVPVEARGVRWGHLVALPGPPHPAGRAGVLEQGAIALALGRLTDADDEEWSRIGRQRLVESLLAGRYDSIAGMAARLEAAGLPIGRALLHGIVIAGADVSVPAAEAAARQIGGQALVGHPRPGSLALVLSLPPRLRFDDARARQFAAALGAGSDRLVLSIGPQADGLDAGLRSLQGALDLSAADAMAGTRGPQLRRVTDRPLARLAAELRDDHRVLAHGQRMLAPLLEHDPTQRGDLLQVLAALLTHPGNRTAAAAAAHLSRSVFYQRLALIAELVGADLDDGEVQAALHLALLVHRAGTPQAPNAARTSSWGNA